MVRSLWDDRERYDDIWDEQIRKPSKDELSCTSFVEFSNATLGKTGRVDASDFSCPSVSFAPEVS
jgi:hypothetical protein